MHENLKWREWVGLHELYEKGKTAKKIQSNAYVKHLIQRRYLSQSLKDRKLIANPSFKQKYEIEHLEKYRHYRSFLSEHDVVNKNSTYTEDDIQSMMLIYENKGIIIKSEDTRRGISSKFFKNGDSKHIENHPGLENAILKLLGLDSFPEQDPKNHQYICVVMCSNPTAVILCENLAFLKLPWKAKERSLELWYVGGNNLSMLIDVPRDKLETPFYYSCDWDHDGLHIYQRVKQYIPTIKLLYPSASNLAKPVKTANHNSEWKNTQPLSGLDQSLYTDKALSLVEKLIDRDEWIEEESNNFVNMVELNQVVKTEKM